MTFPALSLVFIGLAVLVGWLVYRLLRVVIWLLGRVFAGLGFLLRRTGGFVRREVVDVLHATGALATGLAILPLTLANLLIGRTRAAGYYGRAVRDELATTARGLYRVGLGNPLRFLGAGILLDGLERRLPELVERAPGGATRVRRGGTDEFEGYRVFGRLPEGGSGARLFLAHPTHATEERLGRSGVLLPREVVIKSFDVGAGSTLPQIVRESRALEAARRLGLVLDHSLTDDRFFYVMPYVRGEELNAVVHRMHAHAEPGGLGDGELKRVLSLASDLLYQLERFHRGGLWHKDIKPNNLIVASDGRAYLVDFGLVTPLASAMTLTTHGTEYYRDPEMVRLALRGVKVHEVDGVKFDLYSAGAVLFSMVENSFPAQGNLTRITKRCPEALSWIVRRAMADMRTRYSSAREMLQDVACLQASPDPWSVRPADLPSFRASLSEAGAREAELASLAGSPRGFEEDPFPGFTPPPVFPQPPPLAPEPPVSGWRRRRRSRRHRVLVTVAIVFACFTLLRAFQEHQIRNASVAAWARREAPDFWQSPRFDRVEQAYLRLAEAVTGELGSRESRRGGPMARLDSVLPPAGNGGARRLPSGSVGEPSRLLVLEDSAQTLDDEVLLSLHGVFESEGFEIVDRLSGTGSGPETIELMAGARLAVGLSGPDDPEAVRKLQAYLDGSPSLDAILWIEAGSAPNRYTWRALKRRVVEDAGEVVLNGAR